MTLALLTLGVGMMLVLAGVKGYSVRELAQGNYGQSATNQAVSQ
jgi:hypothetical protein